MIGHYVNNLNADQEDSVLTMRVIPGAVIHADNSRCLLGAVLAAGGLGRPLIEWRANPATYMAVGYDKLCGRFGIARVNAAIRNRILSNRARRTLQSRPVEAVR